MNKSNNPLLYNTRQLIRVSQVLKAAVPKTRIKSRLNKSALTHSIPEAKMHGGPHHRLVSNIMWCLSFLAVLPLEWVLPDIESPNSCLHIAHCTILLV
jgi:hypothetical protein